VGGELLSKQRSVARISHSSGFDNCDVQGKSVPRLAVGAKNLILPRTR
jgi:hypothetical protein